MKLRELAYLLDGTTLQLRLKYSAKKNIILRPLAPDILSINLPPRYSAKQLAAWLAGNEAVLRRLRTRAATLPSEQSDDDSLPEQLYYLGSRLPLQPTAEAYGIRPTGSALLVGNRLSKTLLKQWLRQQAAAVLLPALAAHGRELGLSFEHSALSDAKGFWGVCRGRRIRLNWRLIGAPGWVADYVCIHELCHLVEANHSPAFWRLVEAATPHTAAAKQWLKRHGRELFVLG